MKKVFDLIAKLGAVDNMSKTVQSAVGKSQQSLNKFAGNASKLGDNMFDLGTTAGVGALALAAPLVKMVRDAEDGEIAVARLTQVFKSMGETSGVAAKQANAFADSLMYEIAVDADDIMAAQSKLATFENVIKNSTGSSEIFERATKAAFDLQAAGFGDGAGNAVQLGKALNDPIKGMNALTKSGVTFNAQEQAKIKQLVNSGKQFEAQQVILTAIEKQVGGVAAATASDSQKFMLALGDISAELGKSLLPVLKDLAVGIKENIGPMKAWIEANRPMVTMALKAAAALAVFLGTVSVGAYVIGGIAKGVSGAIYAVQMLGQAFGFMSKMILANPIAAAVALGIAAIVGLVIYWDKFMAFLNRQPAALQTIIKLFTAPFVMGAALIRGIMQMWNGDVSGGLNSIWETFKAFNPLTILYEIYANIFAFFGEMAGKFYEAGRNIMTTIADGILSAALAPVDALKGAVSSMRDLLPFSPAKAGPFKDLHKIKIAETIADSIKPAPMVTAMSDMAAMATSVIPPSLMPAMTGGQESAPMPALAGAGGGGGMVLNFSPNISINGAAPGAEGGIEQQVLGALRTVMPDLHKMMQDYLDRQARKRF
jgi:hypothetical protein